jgi:HAE1 family hydrophobic/amphiphilic exporter-1
VRFNVRIAAGLIASLACTLSTAPVSWAAPTTVAPGPASPVPSGLVIPPVPVVEPGYRAPAVQVPAGDVVGVEQQPFVGIALQDAVAMALAKNTDLAVSQSNRRVTGYQIVAAQGAYDVRFQVQPAYDYMRSAPLSPFQSGPNGGAITQTTLGANAAFSGQLTSGTKYSVGFAGQSIQSNNTANGFNPYYTSALSFNLTQPLLRGRYDEARRRLGLARVNADASTDAALLTASSTVANVLDAYWDLVAAWRNVAIQEEALRQARAQAESNARLVKQGATAPVDVVESNTQVDVSQDNVLSAIQNVGRLQNQLKQLTLADPADPIWTANLVPVTPALDLPAEPPLNDLVLAALRNRPEIGQLREQRRSADVNVAYARDQARPQVDLNLGYTSNGFAGQPASLTQNPIFTVFGPLASATNALIAYANAHGGMIPPLQIAFPQSPSYLTGNFGTSVNTLLQNKFPVVAVSATIGFPIANRTARGNYAAALEQQRTLEVQQVALIQRILFEARNALQSLRAAKARLRAASAARAAAERVYASEVRRFRAGTSTTFLVLQRETDLANQRGRELQAQTDLNKAVVEIDRVSGSILAKNNVDVGALGSSPTTTTTLPVRETPPPPPRLSPLP